MPCCMYSGLYVGAGIRTQVLMHAQQVFYQLRGLLASGTVSTSYLEELLTEFSVLPGSLSH